MQHALPVDAAKSMQEFSYLVLFKFALQSGKYGVIEVYGI